MPVDAVMPSPAADIKNPPSRPPSCSGMKNSILANSEVKANMRMHCTYVMCGVSTKMEKYISAAEQFEHDGCYQCALVLVMQGSHLMVDGEQLFMVAISKSPNTFAHPW